MNVSGTLFATPIYTELNTILGLVMHNGSTIDDDKMQEILTALKQTRINVSDVINPPTIIKTEYFTTMKGSPTRTMFYAHLKLYSNNTFIAQLICDSKQIDISNETFQLINYANGDVNKIKHLSEIQALLGQDIMDIDKLAEQQYTPVAADEGEADEQQSLIDSAE